MTPIRTIDRNRDRSITFRFYNAQDSEREVTELRAEAVRWIANKLNPSFKIMLVAIAIITAAVTVTLFVRPGI